MILYVCQYCITFMHGVGVSVGGQIELVTDTHTCIYTLGSFRTNAYRIDPFLWKQCMYVCASYE